MVPNEGTWAGLPVFPRVFYGGVRDESKDNNDEQYGKWLEGAGVLRTDAGKKRRRLRLRRLLVQDR